MTETHQPVLYQEIILALCPKSGGRYLDGTVGSGGHAARILDASAPQGQLLGLDIDPQALRLARQKLSPYGGRVTLRQASYANMHQILLEAGWQNVDGIILDLGASSMQFDTPERGFAFQSDGPLDMRYDPSRPCTAADLVNNLPEADLADIIYRYGEEHQARRIARAIVKTRPVTSTRQLAQIISKAIPARQRIHPATQTFQALRIAVNEELSVIESALPRAAAALVSGGRLAVISFHSLEDRIVKEYFRQESRDCLCPSRQPVCTCGHKASLKTITRHPIRPTEAEIYQNPRARSAKLRIAEKI